MAALSIRDLDAICLANDAVLATRDVKDFEHTGVEVIDPWVRT